MGLSIGPRRLPLSHFGGGGRPGAIALVIGEGGAAEADLTDASRADRSEEKERWRRQMRALRNSLSPERHLALSRQICRRLDALLAVLGARAVGIYWPVRGESDLSALWEESARAGREFYFPRVQNEGMTFHAVRDPGRDLRPGRFGIPAPEADAPPGDLAALDAVVAPGLAFGPAGERIGAGGGYYDHLFAAMPSRPPLVGAGFAFQLVWNDPLPAGPDEGFMDWIVTDREAVRCLPRT
ncbi:MAG: 5-formyltetrahydrofolate cyclo-ligase [bacterium]